MKNNKKHENIYIIYEFNKNNNDYRYIKEYNNIIDLKQEFNLSSKTNLSKYYIYSIDDIPNTKQSINNKYFILKEKI